MLFVQASLALLWFYEHLLVEFAVCHCHPFASGAVLGNVSQQPGSGFQIHIFFAEYARSANAFVGALASCPTPKTGVQLRWLL